MSAMQVNLPRPQRRGDASLPERGSHEPEDRDNTAQKGCRRACVGLLSWSIGKRRMIGQSAAKSVFIVSSHPGQMCCS